MSDIVLHHLRAAVQDPGPGEPPHGDLRPGLHRGDGSARDGRQDAYLYVSVTDANATELHLRLPSGSDLVIARG